MYHTLTETYFRLRDSLTESMNALEDGTLHGEFIIPDIQTIGKIPIEALLNIYRKVRSDGVIHYPDTWDYKPTSASIPILARCTDEIEARVNLIKGEYVGIIKNQITNLHHNIIAASQEDDPSVKYLEIINRFMIRGIRNNLMQMLPSDEVKKTLDAIDFYLHKILNIVEEDNCIKLQYYLNGELTAAVILK